MPKSSTLALCMLGAVVCAPLALADESASQSAHAAPIICTRDTGTRIKLASSECTASPSRTYTKEDIERTGKTTVAGALRVLDPSVTIQH